MRAGDAALDRRDPDGGRQADPHWQIDSRVKLHVVYDPGAAVPTCFAVTSAWVSDITPTRRFPRGRHHCVFDKSHYDFAFQAALNGRTSHIGALGRRTHSRG